MSATLAPPAREAEQAEKSTTPPTAVTLAASATAPAAAAPPAPPALVPPAHTANAANAAPASSADQHPAVASVLFTAQQLSARVEALGAQCAADYAEKSPVLMTILKGGFIFAADFTRFFRPWPKGTSLSFCRARSYGARTETSGQVQVEGLEADEIKGRHVLLLDDLSDSGLTLQTVRERCLEAGALSVKAAVALDKAERRLPHLPRPEYVGFDCPNVWVSGLGMDTNELYRGLGGGSVVVLSKAAQDEALGRR